MNQSLSDMEHPLSQFRYCPKCGSEHFKVHNEKSKQCADCGFIYYFNPSSATVALILNEKNELLVCRRAKDPAKGTLDLPGGFIDMNETGEEGVAREVLEETGLKVEKTTYLFTLPNIYVYSGFPVHTLDMFFLCRVKDTSHIAAMDDAADAFFVPLMEIHPEDFGLDSIRKGLDMFILLTLRVIHESRPANRRAFSLIEAFRLSPTSSKGYPLPVQTGDSEWYGWKRLIPAKVLDQRPLYKSRFYHRTLLPVHQEQGIIFYNKYTTEHENQRCKACCL